MKKELQIVKLFKITFSVIFDQFFGQDQQKCVALSGGVSWWSLQNSFFLTSIFPAWNQQQVYPFCCWNCQFSIKHPWGENCNKMLHPEYKRCIGITVCIAVNQSSLNLLQTTCRACWIWKCISYLLPQIFADLSKNPIILHKR